MSHFETTAPRTAPEEPDGSRAGLILFALYTSVYACFVLVAAFRPDWMARTVAGVNVAVLAGFGLILGAIALAALYLWLCRPSVDAAIAPAASAADGGG